MLLGLACLMCVCVETAGYFAVVGICTGAALFHIFYAALLCGFENDLIGGANSKVMSQKVYFSICLAFSISNFYTNGVLVCLF